jgi:asparagine synthase (glutamine-hydrolysing)
MFQLLYIGHKRGAKIWQRKAAIHASRLGLRSNHIQWIIKPERQVLFTSIDHSSLLEEGTLPRIVNYENGFIAKQENNRWVLTCFENKKDYYDAIRSYGMDNMWMAISPDGDPLYLWCGIIATDQLYYCRETGGILVSNDLRLFVSADTNDLDPAGFYSLFHFGALSSPYTVFKNAKRVPPGHLLKFSSPDFIEEIIPHPLEDFRAHLSASLPSETRLEKALTAEIDKLPLDSGIFFSGGVDSGLLAALAKRQGRSDLRLINCNFSASLGVGMIDHEAELAREMAAHLGYKLYDFSFDVSLVPKTLARIGDDYIFPFSDYSTIAQNQLVQYAKSTLKPGSFVMDGTGADAIFWDGFASRRMGALYQIPIAIRKFLALWYRSEKVFSSGWVISEILGTINETLKIPLMQLIVFSTNKLSGCAFIEKSFTINNVLQTQRDYIETLLSPFDRRTRMSLLDLLWVCAGIFAAKGFNPLRLCGLKPFFPFLSEKIIVAGASLMQDQAHLYGNKRALKALLLRDVPYEMIYRPKSGFRPPLRKILNDSKVKEYINDNVLVDNNPVNEFVYYSTVKNLFSRIWKNEQIGKHHFSFLWAYIFGSLWLKHQLQSCRSASKYDSGSRPSSD